MYCYFIIMAITVIIIIVILDTSPCSVRDDTNAKLFGFNSFEVASIVSKAFT